jgi:hypothetical protein
LKKVLHRFLPDASMAFDFRVSSRVRWRRIEVAAST